MLKTNMVKNRDYYSLTYEKVIDVSCMKLKLNLIMKSKFYEVSNKLVLGKIK